MVEKSGVCSHDVKPAEPSRANQKWMEAFFVYEFVQLSSSDLVGQRNQLLAGNMGPASMIHSINFRYFMFKMYKEHSWTIKIWKRKIVKFIKQIGTCKNTSIHG